MSDSAQTGISSGTGTGTGTITVTIADGVATVEIDNPAQRNALTKAMCMELQDVAPRLDADPAVKVVAVRGAGASFSAGATINALTSVLLDPQDDGSTIDRLSLADKAIASIAKPTIAIVDGACMGGGWQLASACDFIVSSERSRFAITPAKLGVIYPRRGIERLVRQVGPANAKFILFSAKTFTAREAQGLGLVSHVVDDAGFDDYGRRFVESVRDRSQFAIHTLKHLIDLTAENRPGLDDEWDAAWAGMSESPDMQIGVTAFLGRETPRFTWSPT
jgi:enoyl-CoA hydratase/carnithine racemase